MKIVKSALKYSGKFLDMYIDTAEKDDGTIVNWERCSRKNKTNAVMIIPYHKTLNALIMIAEYRVPTAGYEVGFPAGLIDKTGEQIDDVIRRELKEETGLDLVKVYRVSPPGYNSAGMTDETISIAYVEVDGDISTEFLEKDEEILPFVASKDVIVKMLNDKTVNWGAKSWIICDQFVNGVPF